MLMKLRRINSGLEPAPVVIRKDGKKLAPLLDWTQKHRAFLAPGRAFDLDAHPYLRAIYECRAREMVVYKASQVGVTEYAVSYALHAADVRACTVLYVFPTEAHVSDFSTARVGPAIEASPYLAGLIVSGGDGEGRRGADRVTLKRVRDRFLYLRGGQVKPNGQAPQLKSVDADVLILDEVDEMDARAPSIAVKRLGHSAVGEVRRISTPSYPGMGIHAAWQESDQREWCLPCPSCGKRQFLTIGHIVTEWDELERPVAWHGQKDGRAWAACEACGAELDRTAAGEWAPMATSEIAGFHPTRLMLPQVDLLSIVQALSTVDATKRKEAYNQDLGLPYKPQGSGLDDLALDACRREYGYGPKPGEGCVMGVDVGRVLHVVIRGQPDNETGERAQRWAGEVLSFDDLGPLMTRYGVTRCVIDALPETRSARLFQQAQPRGRVWLAYYVQGARGTKAAEPVAWDNESLTVNIDRTRILDETVSRFLVNANTLPGSIRATADYYEHLKALVRAEHQQPDGTVVAVYVESGPDHFAHAEAYATAASMPHKPPTAGTWGRRR